MQSRFLFTAAVVTLLRCSGAATAGDPTVTSWQEFRNEGPSHSMGPLPTVWSIEKEITWKKELPGYGQSSPLAFDSKVFMTAVIGPKKDEIAIVCLDLKTGEGAYLIRTGTRLFCVGGER